MNEFRQFSLICCLLASFGCSSASRVAIGRPMAHQLQPRHQVFGGYASWVERSLDRRTLRYFDSNGKCVATWQRNGSLSSSCAPEGNSNIELAPSATGGRSNLLPVALDIPYLEGVPSPQAIHNNVAFVCMSQARHGFLALNAFGDELGWREQASDEHLFELREAVVATPNSDVIDDLRGHYAGPPEDVAVSLGVVIDYQRRRLSDYSRVRLAQGVCLLTQQYLESQGVQIRDVRIAEGEYLVVAGASDREQAKRVLVKLIPRLYGYHRNRFSFLTIQFEDWSGLKPWAEKADECSTKKRR